MENIPQLTNRERHQQRKEEKMQAKIVQSRSKVIKKWLKIIGIVSFIVASIIWYNYSNPPISSKDLLSIKSDDWFKGKNEAQVTVIEYLDFECEACGAIYPVTKRISEEFGGQVKFVTRYFPLDGHRNSITSALAAEAAGKQGKFWEMHDKLFENQITWGESRDSKSYVFEKYAEELGLDIQKFKQDVKLNETRNRIERDRLSGIRLGINSTPSFFLNGEKIVNPRGYQEFKELIQKALNVK